MKKKLTQEKVDFILLQETKCDRETMNKIANKVWKNSKMECIEVEGASGGLAILWNPDYFKVERVLQHPRILSIHFHNL
jgi:exonuclease III